MRIDEITRPKTKNEAGYRLYNAGYQPLGSGLYARVYQKPGAKYVLKMFRSDDLCYPNYVRMVKQHQDNPHFPKIFGRLVRVTSEYYAVRTEHLEWGYTKLDQPVRAFIANYAYRPSPEEQVALAQRYAQVIQQYPRLEEACKLILTVSPEGKDECNVDIHSENVMLRDGFPVFTDPLS
jgi:hypothetical protein